MGNWRLEHLFTLKQSRELYRMYQQQVVECNHEIEQLLGAFEPRVDPNKKPLPPDRKRNRSGKKRRKKNGNLEIGFDLRTEAYKLFGVDVTQIPGVETIAFPLFSEIGRDLSKWSTASHFASWLGLCPDNDISGGRVLWKGVRKVKNRAGQMFRPSGTFTASKPHPVGKLFTADESQTRSGSSHYRHGAQDCHDLLHIGDKTGGI